MKTDRIRLLLVVSIALTVTSGVITYYAILESRGRLDWVLHTTTVLSQGHEAISSLKDLQLNRRGYLLTEDSTYLRRSSDASRELFKSVDSLKRMTRDNQAQLTYLSTTIIPMIRRTERQIGEDITLFNSLNDASRHEFLKHDKTRQMMDTLSLMMDKFNQTEVSLLNERIGTMNNTLDRHNLTRYISFVLISLVSLAALIALGRHQRQNQILIRKLEQANQTLEQKVEERTRELAKQNDNISELNEELRMNMEEMESFYETLHVKSLKTEDKLKEIRDLYENAPCGYHSLNENGLIVHMNERELGWLGYRPEEVIGKMYVTEMLKPEEHQSYYDDFARFKQHGFIVNKEHNFVRKDGSTFAILLNATASYDENGKYIMSRGSVIDISDKKATELKLLKANKDLIQLNEEKDHFLGIAAHDLKNPLIGIVGLINLIMKKNDNLTSEQLEYLKYIQRSCKSMQTLIIDLLDINKIEQGVVSINPEMVTLGAISSDLMTLFKESARIKNISLHIECNEPAKKIITDPNALTRILENLLSNAIKFSPKNKAVWLNIIHNHAVVRFEVADQGQGISKEDMPKLFKKFQKLQAQPTDKEGSTGLGLSIVKELVKALHGKISVESEVNVGSRFIIELPVA